VLQIRLGSIKCNDDTDEAGGDRPYLLVTAVALPPPPQPGNPGSFAGPFDVTLYTFVKMDSDSRTLFGSVGHRFPSFWGVGGLPANLADTLNGIVLVALMENDEGKPALVRASVLAAVQPSLLRSMSLPRAGKVPLLLGDVNSARNIPTAGGSLLNDDDAIGDVQELSFSEDELQRADLGEVVVRTLQFFGDDAHYTLTFEAFNPAYEGLSAPPPPPSPRFATGNPTRQLGAMELFRSCHNAAPKPRFLGGFPNFFYKPGSGGVGFTATAIFLTGAAAEWRDVPLSELNNVELNNFEARMREANVYARRNGFVGGFPNYFHQDYHDGRGIVCGTILIKSLAATSEDVSLKDLGNPALDDYDALFTGTQLYAERGGFLGGFPDLSPHKQLAFDPATREPVMRTVCGAVLIRSNYFDGTSGRRGRAAELGYV
jgi:hypothetical protein